MRPADHSSRGAQPTVVCRCVSFRNLVNEAALAHLGVIAPKKNVKFDYLHLKAPVLWAVS